MTSKIEIQGISKYYNEQKVLDNVNLKIKSGEFVTLLGPSGCGKTTLLKIIADLEKPSAGIVLIDGADNEEARKGGKYGMVFQTPALLDWRTAIDNIKLPLEIAGVPRQRRQEIAQEQLELVDLKGYETHYPFELSGGMRQRVGIARALSMDPDILLMDEPFSALDEFTRERLHGDLLRIWHKTGKTIVFVTHNISEAVYLSDRVCVFTTHPASLAEVVEITLPRPRKLIRNAPEYFETVSHIRKMFEEYHYESI